MGASFDYIIIGAGSAGGTLAARLSEDGRNQVLLLEGGGSHRNLLIDMPAGWGQMIYHHQYSWGTQPSPSPGPAGAALPCPGASGWAARPPSTA